MCKISHIVVYFAYFRNALNYPKSSRQTVRTAHALMFWNPQLLTAKQCLADYGLFLRKKCQRHGWETHCLDYQTGKHHLIRVSSIHNFEFGYHFVSSKDIGTTKFHKKNHDDCLILHNIIVSTSFLIFCSYLL